MARVGVTHHAGASWYQSVRRVSSGSDDAESQNWAVSSAEQADRAGEDSGNVCSGPVAYMYRAGNVQLFSGAQHLDSVWSCVPRRFLVAVVAMDATQQGAQ